MAGNGVPNAWESDSRCLGTAFPTGWECSIAVRPTLVWESRACSLYTPFALLLALETEVPCIPTDYAAYIYECPTTGNAQSTICCFRIQRSISPCKTDRGRCSPSPLASAKAGRQCGICPYPITMDITAERRDVNTPYPRTDISILLQCGLFLLHITAEDTVDLRTLFPVKRIVRLDQPAVVNLDGL